MIIGAGGSAGSRSHIDASKGNNTTFENYVANGGAAGSNVLGGKGGSGGGGNGGYCLAGGIGGINGRKGGNSVDNKGKNGGPGQGSNTCEFGEMNGNECVEGNTYSTGRAGGKARQTALIPNSGNGGNGGVGLYDNVDNKAYRCNNPTINPTAGSSGIIVIRNAR